MCKPLETMELYKCITKISFQGGNTKIFPDINLFFKMKYNVHFYLLTISL